MSATRTRMTAPAHDVQPKQAESPEAAVRDRVAAWLHDVRAGDLDRIMAHYSDDVVAFDAVAALQFKGAAAYRAHWEACIAVCPDHAIFELHDLGIAASGDVGFAHWLCRCGAVQEGREKGSWMRATQCLRRVNGTWRIVHEHFCAPFDFESGQALLSATP